MSACKACVRSNNFECPCQVYQPIEDTSSSSGTKLEDLTGWKATLSKAAILAPKLLFSGIGWTAGAALGAVFGAGVGTAVGAGIGDLLGTAVGCAISFMIEYAIRSCLDDPTLKDDEALKKLKETRMGETAILCTGAFFGGLVFNPALKWTAKIANPLAQKAAASVITSGAFFGGMQAARGAYTVGTKVCGAKANPALELSKQNAIGDAVLSASIIAPAELGFYLVPGVASAASPVVSALANAGAGGGAVAAGGLAGHLATDGTVGTVTSLQDRVCSRLILFKEDDEEHQKQFLTKQFSKEAA